MTDFYRRRSELYAEFPQDAEAYESEFNDLALCLALAEMDAERYRWIHDSVEHIGGGIFRLDLSGIEPDTDCSECMFEWRVGQAMKNEARAADSASVDDPEATVHKEVGVSRPAKSVRTPADQPSVNQCDGCRQGLIQKDGIHWRDGLPWIACTADMYAETVSVGDKDATR